MSSNFKIGFASLDGVHPCAKSLKWNYKIKQIYRRFCFMLLRRREVVKHLQDTMVLLVVLFSIVGSNIGVVHARITRELSEIFRYGVNLNPVHDGYLLNSFTADIPRFQFGYPPCGNGTYANGKSKLPAPQNSINYRWPPYIFEGPTEIESIVGFQNYCNQTKKVFVFKKKWKSDDEALKKLKIWREPLYLDQATGSTATLVELIDNLKLKSAYSYHPLRFAFCNEIGNVLSNTRLPDGSFEWVFLSFFKKPHEIESSCVRSGGDGTGIVKLSFIGRSPDLFASLGKRVIVVEPITRSVFIYSPTRGKFCDFSSSKQYGFAMLSKEHFSAAMTLAASKISIELQHSLLGEDLQRVNLVLSGIVKQSIQEVCDGD